jgi:hypothetical protein
MAAELKAFITVNKFTLLEVNKETGKLKRDLSPIKRILSQFAGYSNVTKSEEKESSQV